MSAIILCIKFNTFTFAERAHALRQTDRQTDKVKGIKLFFIMNLSNNYHKLLLVDIFVPMMELFHISPDI
jgi:hypothetical protein